MSDDDFDLDAILNDALDELDKAENISPPKHTKPVKPTINTDPAPRNEPVANNPANFDPSSDEFKQEMEQFMKLLSDGSADGGDKADLAEMEKMLSALHKPEPTQNGPNKKLQHKASPTSSTSKDPVTSGDIIKDALKMMSKGRETMKQNETGILGDDEEIIAKLFKGLKDIDPENPESLEGALNSMMDGLFTKEILQDPIKRVAKDYPNWLEANKSNLSPELFSKYTLQCETFKEIEKIMEEDDPDMGHIRSKIDEMMEDGELPDELRKKMFSDVDPAALFEGGAFDPKALLGGEDPKDEDIKKLIENCPVQ